MKVILLEISTIHLNQVEVLHPTLIQDGSDVFLIDCGYEGSLPAIRKELAKNHLGIQDLTGVIISHDDIDHLGGLFEIKAVHPGVKVYSSRIEAPYVNGSEKSLRLIQVEESLGTIPEDFKEWALAFQKSLRAIKRVAVDQTFEFDAPYSENLKIINTPGHTPGHISIYIPNQKLLIANDALVVENNELEIANPAFTLDLKQAVASVKKITGLEIDKLFCYHGGAVVENVSAKIEKLINKYSGDNSAI